MKQKCLRAECLEPRALLSASLPTGPAIDTTQLNPAATGQELVTEETVPQRVVLAGDFNGDSLINDVDINMLTANLGDNSQSEFDLTLDGLVDRGDMDMLIHDIIGTEYGDADLDGHIGPWDAFVVLRNMFSGATGWAAGDFSCDGIVDGQDFIEWSRFRFTETPLRRTLTDRTEVVQIATALMPSSVAAAPREAALVTAAPATQAGPEAASQPVNLTQATPSERTSGVAESKADEPTAHPGSSDATSRANLATNVSSQMVERPSAIRTRFSFRSMRTWG